jgi:hypothetical protein
MYSRRHSAAEPWKRPTSETVGTRIVSRCSPSSIRPLDPTSQQPHLRRRSGEKPFIVVLPLDHCGFWPQPGVEPGPTMSCSPSCIRRRLHAGDNHSRELPNPPLKANRERESNPLCHVLPLAFASQNPKRPTRGLERPIHLPDVVPSGFGSFVFHTSTASIRAIQWSGSSWPEANAAITSNT